MLHVLPAAATVYQDESCMRKGSTASLSYIEGALNQSARSVGVRANSSQNLMQSSTDAWYSDGDHPTNVASTTGDGVTSPVSTTSTKSTGRFFVFGGTRTARKQRQVCTSSSSSSRMCVMNRNWSATKQRLHPQSVAEISRQSVLSGDRIRQCGTSFGSRH